MFIFFRFFIVYPPGVVISFPSLRSARCRFTATPKPVRSSSSAISLQLYSCSKRRRSISTKFGSSSDKAAMRLCRAFSSPLCVAISSSLTSGSAHFLRRFDRTMFRASLMAALLRYAFGFFRKTRDGCPSKNLTKTFSIASSASCRFPVTHFAVRYIDRKFSRHSASSSCLKSSSFVVGTFVVAILSPIRAKLANSLIEYGCCLPIQLLELRPCHKERDPSVAVNSHMGLVGFARPGLAGVYLCKPDNTQIQREVAC